MPNAERCPRGFGDRDVGHMAGDPQIRNDANDRFARQVEDCRGQHEHGPGAVDAAPIAPSQRGGQRKRRANSLQREIEREHRADRHAGRPDCKRRKQAWRHHEAEENAAAAPDPERQDMQHTCRRVQLRDANAILGPIPKANDISSMLDEN